MSLIKSCKNFSLAVLLLGLGLACQAPLGEIAVSTRWASGQALTGDGQEFVLPLSVVKLRVQIAGPGMKDLTREFDLSDLQGQTQLEIKGIPLGPSRQLEVWGLEQDGWVAYYGHSQKLAVTADRVADAQVEVHESPGAKAADGSVLCLALSINGDDDKTAQREVQLQLDAAGMTDMFFSNDLPDPVAECADFAWQAYSSDPVAWAIGDLDGNQNVYALVRDANGYCSRPIGDSIILDRQGPHLDESHIIVQSNIPGQDDQVLGQDGAVEAAVTVEVYTDAALSQFVGSTDSDENGAFAAIDLGDNYQDNAQQIMQGQGIFWLSAVDSLGNRGTALSFETDVLAPTIDVQSLTVLSNPPGTDDVLSAPANWTEPLVQAFLYASADATTALSTVQIAADGALPALSLGDNYSLAGLVSGQAQFWLQVIDAAGNASARLMVQSDVEAPHLNANLLVVDNQKPGQDDVLEGLAEFTEPGAQLSVFADDGMMQQVSATLVHQDGSFAPLSLGDNYEDQALGHGQGQAQYWLQLTDAAGNSSAASSFAVDLSPPQISIVSVSRTHVGLHQPVQVVVHTDAPLLGAPDVVLRGAGYSPLCPDLEASDPAYCSRGASQSAAHYSDCCAVNPCAELDPESNNYTCHLRDYCDENGDNCDIADAANLTLKVRASDSVTGNVAQIDGPHLHFDWTRPSNIPDQAVVVHMNVKGQSDQLSAQGLEPNGVLRLFQLGQVIPMGGTRCWNEMGTVDLAIDASGRIDPIDIGDNAWNRIYARQIDAAGNDACAEMATADACPWAKPCQDSSVLLLNDTIGPEITVAGIPDPVSLSDHVSLQVVLTEQGPEDSQGQMLVSDPATLTCRLDNADFAPCPMQIEREGLASGAHVLELQPYDALANPGSLQKIEWFIASAQEVYDAPEFSEISDSAYFVDSDQRGHLFVGGDKLYHIFQNASAQFESEVIYGEAVSSPRAVFVDGVFYLIFASDEQQLMRFASGSTAHWSSQILAAAEASDGAYDLATQDDGSVHVVFSDCDASYGDCVHNGDNLNKYRLLESEYRPQTGWTASSEISGASFAMYPRLALDGQQDLWLAYVHNDKYHNDVSLHVRQKIAGEWQAELSDPDGLQDKRMKDPHLSLSFPATGSLLLTYVPNDSDWEDRVQGLHYNMANNAWTTHLFADGHKDYLCSAPASDGRLWFASKDSWTLGFDMYDPSTPEWLDGASTYNAQSRVIDVKSMSMAVVAPGDFSSVHLQVAYQASASNSDSRIVIRILDQNGTTTSDQLLPIASGLGDVTMVKNAARPTIVWLAEDQGKILLSRYVNGLWQAPETVLDDIAGRGSGLVALADGEDIWLAYGSAAAQDCLGTCIDLDHYSAAAQTWQHLGPATPTAASDYAYRPKLAIAATGALALAYKQGDSASEVALTLYDGSAFSSPATLIDDLGGAQKFAFIGDANGSAADGLLCVPYIDDSGNVSSRALDPGALTSTPTADCVGSLSSISFTPSQLAIGQNNLAKPVLIVAGRGQNLARLSYSDGQWVYDDLGTQLEGQKYDFQTQSWIDDSSIALYNLSYLGALSFIYDADQRMHMVGRLDSFGSLAGYVLFTENADASIAMRLIKSEDSNNGDAGIAWDAADGAVICWKDPRRADITCMREGVLQ